MLTGAEDNIVLSRSPSISCATSHKTCQQLPYNKRHPILGCPLTRDPWVLPAKPDIPPMAAPPEASYRRPEDNIVLSHSHSIPCTTSHKTRCQTLQQKAPYTGCLLIEIREFGQTTRHTPHGRTSATPSPQRMKILTRKYLLGRVAHECRGHYCFISPTQNTTRVIYLGLSRPALPRTP